MTAQIRLRTLLKEDRIYRAWFQKVPTLTIMYSAPPWRLYVQKEKDGPWSRVDLRGYVKAYTQVRLRLPEVWDMCIHSKGQRFKPPIVRKGTKRVYAPMPEGHLWCELCRRPTVFKKFRKHPALKYMDNSDEIRCSICGAKASSMGKYKSPLTWPIQSSL